MLLNFFHLFSVDEIFVEYGIITGHNFFTFGCFAGTFEQSNSSPGTNEVTKIEIPTTEETCVGGSCKYEIITNMSRI